MQYSTSTYNDIEYFSQSNCTLQPTKFKLCKLIRYESYVNILHCQHSKQFKNAIIFFTSPTHSMSVTGGSLLTIKSNTLNTSIQIQGRQDTDRLTFVDPIFVDHMTVVTEYTVICIFNRYTLYSKIHLYVGLCPPPPNENCLIFFA